ncbi:hypothetical protein BGZ89_002505 [Linnemannia elongata]|nr:hypothetical protein BGZ89_002505 [Linnemannia elongata]
MRSRMTIIIPSTNSNLCLMYERTLDGQPQVILHSHMESSADSMDLPNFEDAAGTARCHRKLQTNNLLLTVNKWLLRIEGSQDFNRSHQRHFGYSLNASTVSFPGSDENSKLSPPSLPFLQKQQEVQAPLAQPTVLMMKRTLGWRSYGNT